MDSRSLLPIGTKLQRGKYRVDRYLSSGSFGNTYVITDLQSGNQYAMKEFFMKGVNERGKDYTTICVSNKVNYERYEQQREKFKKEARRMRQLSNKHLVKVYDLFDENGTTYYVMDLIHGQTMQDAMEETGRTYTESQAINVIYQILEALDTLHQKGIWHLDLKPANIMINDQGLVKVIDFGASKQMNANLEYTSTSAAICYTPGFAPTEQVDQNISRIGPWTDLYALGATLYYMLTGSQPPSSSEILDGYAFQFKFPVSEDIRQLIIWMMKPNRKDRPQSVAEVRHYLDKIQKSAPAVEKNEIKEDNRHTHKGWGIAIFSFLVLLSLSFIGPIVDMVKDWGNENPQEISRPEENQTEKDQQIKSLTDSIIRLRERVIDEKEKAAEAEEKAAEAKAEAAERAKAEAEKKAQEREKAAEAKAEAAERAKEKAEQAAEAAKHATERAKSEAATKQEQEQDKSAKAALFREKVIAILGKASKFSEAKDREFLRLDAINMLKGLTHLDPVNKSAYLWCIHELEKSITRKDNGRGQYSACINKLKIIK